jgi:hypothetical protein
VPAAIDRGTFDVLKRGATYVRMRADLDLRNHLGFEFAIDVLRDVFLLTRRGVEAAIDVKIPSWIDVTGSLSVQQLARAGRRPWGPRTGMPQLWILSQFPAGPRVTVFAPVAARAPVRREGRVKPYEDRYFGEPGARRLWEAEPPHSERCVYFRADGKLRSKFGLRPALTTGLAGSLDADRGLLTLVKFDVRPRARYGSFLWRPTDAELWRGDAFQSYNSGDGTFYELESVSPARPSSPGSPITHAHATCFLRGEPARLREFLYLTLDVTIPEAPLPS